MWCGEIFAIPDSFGDVIWQQACFLSTRFFKNICKLRIVIRASGWSDVIYNADFIFGGAHYV